MRAPRCRVDGTVWAEYVVAYLDVCGQKDALAEMARLPQNEDEEFTFSCAVQRTSEALKTVKACLGMWLANGPRGAPGAPTQGGLSPLLRREFDKLDGREVRLHSFSDSFILYAPLFNDRRQRVLSNVPPLIEALARGMILCVAQHIPLRGGVELGVGAEVEGCGFYGAALDAAYRLESRAARYPRLVVGDAFMNTLSTLTGTDRAKDGFDSINRFFAKQLLSMVAKDRGGKPIVDYLGDCLRRTCNVAWFREEAEAGYIFATESHERFAKSRKAKDRELAGRYRRLRDYYASRAANWGLERM